MTGGWRTPKLAHMKVELTPQQEEKLTKLAESKGCEASELAQEVLRYYLEHEAQFVEAVKRGLESLDSGKSVSHEEVGKRLERLMRS